MIKIDQNDELYQYLTEVGALDIENEYNLLASNGRYKRKDIRAFYLDILRPSVITEDIDESELEKVVDFFTDIKKIKNISKEKERKLLKMYKENPTEELFNLIFNNKLKDVLYLSINYKSTHKDVDIQDVVQTANIGLMTAIRKFANSKKLTFEDFLAYWISQKLKEEFKEKENV